MILSLSALLLLSSCGTYAGSGAYAGASLGSILGSAVGGITGGPRGSDIGTLVGMAGGAMVGGAIGAQADNAQRQEQPRYSNRPSRQSYENDAYYDDNHSQNYTQQGNDESGFDPSNSGDDVLYDFNSTDYTGSYSAAKPEKVTPSVRYDGIKAVSPKRGNALEVRNARFVDDNQDGRLSAGEFSKVIFEVYNTSQNVLTDIQPTVIETSGNRQIAVSQGIHVERIAPGRGIRYTAMVKAGNRLKNGTSCFRVYVAQGNGRVASNICEFNVPTSRR